MFDYLQKFNNLPKALRDKVSSPTAMRAVSALELKYKVDLAALVMKVMTKTLAVKDLPEYFVNEFSLSQEEARALQADILKEILAPVSEYLNLDGTKKPPEISEFSSALIKEAGLSLPSGDLYLRLRNIMLTFLKGVRSKIDAKNSLMKKVEFGGLGLSQEEADRVFKLAERQNQKKEKVIAQEEINLLSSDQALVNQAAMDQSLVKKQSEKSSREKLDQIIMAAETNSVPVYDLKKALAEKNDKAQVLPKEKEVKENSLPKEAEQVLLPLEEEEILLPLMKEKLRLEEKSETESIPELAPTLKPIPTPEPIPETLKKTEPKQVESKQTEPRQAELKQVELKKPEPKKSEPQEDYVAPTTLNLNFKRPAPTSTKPRIEDIKSVAKAMSPIDELAFLDLTNFRRLSDNADEAVLKIFNKIKLLERDGYDKMVAGVKAWRQNEVNRLYVKIGQEALLKDLSLKEVVLERQKRNMPYLKIEEINAISKLNGRLSF